MSLKQCCATGSLHTGTPTGRTEKVHGRDCYIADPPGGSPKGIVVIVPDAFGIALPNNKILADEYAKKGNFRVYLPDFMHGFELPGDVMISVEAMSATGLWNQLYKIGHAFYLLRWMLPFMYYCRPGVAREGVFDFFKAFRAKEAANLPLGVAGFCWGGKFVTELCWDQTKTSDGKRLVDCGFVAHPSFLSYPGDIEMITLPYSVAAAGNNDPQMGPEQLKQTKEILAAKTAKTKDSGVEHEFVLFDGANHGFAVRANEEDKDEAERGKKAEAQAVAWFSKWFSNPPPTVS